MTISEAIEQLLATESVQQKHAYDENTIAVGFARLGSEDQCIVAGTLGQLQTVEFGAPLHCLVIAGELCEMEKEHLSLYRVSS